MGAPVLLLSLLALTACGGDEAASADTTAHSGETTAEGSTAEGETEAASAEGESAAAVETGTADTAAEIAALESRVAALEAAIVRLTGAGDFGGETASDAEEPAVEETTPAASEEAAAEPPHWNYEEAEAWGTLSEEYATCDTGAQQSPINLVEPEPADLPNAAFTYEPSAATIINNGHTVQVNLAAGGAMVLDDVEYQLVQFHFHGPSEHTVDGDSYPLEIHFVHKAADGALAVLGVLVEIGEEDAAWNELIASLPTQTGVEVPLATQIDADDLMPEIRAAYRYSGSLTTPPCTEGVEWQVLIATAAMSGQQIDAIRSQFAEENNRPVQVVGDRSLEVDLSW